MGAPILSSSDDQDLRLPALQENSSALLIGDEVVVATSVSPSDELIRALRCKVRQLEEAQERSSRLNNWLLASLGVLLAFRFFRSLI
ncbi:unnamed protein product [Protopolystoma xenopodis]|uniref:Uncharacterized protein n=1 Tax=Protopolystoma xenopodis TaxID=117903 RepID=A0A448X8W5_9PLAT|nr:unnamed protein product [Protopolystoma xenopodis]